MPISLENLLDAYERFYDSIDDYERRHGRRHVACQHHHHYVPYDGECGGIDEIKNHVEHHCGCSCHDDNCGKEASQHECRRHSDEAPVCIDDFSKLIKDIFGDSVEVTITDSDGNVVKSTDDIVDVPHAHECTNPICSGIRDERNHQRNCDCNHFERDMRNVNYIPSWDCPVEPEKPEADDTMAEAIDNLQLEYGDIILVRTAQDDGSVALVPGVLTDWNVTTDDDDDIDSLSVEFVRISRGRSAGDMMTAVCDKDDIDAGEIINLDIDGTFEDDAEMVRGLSDTIVEIVDLIYPNDGLSATGIDDCPNVSRMLTSTLIENLHVLAEAIARHQ